MTWPVYHLYAFPQSPSNASVYSNVHASDTVPNLVPQYPTQDPNEHIYAQSNDPVPESVPNLVPRYRNERIFAQSNDLLNLTWLAH